MARTRWSISILLAGLWGCSLLVQFDPESQPCDQAGACLAGYFCSDAGLCKSTDGGAPVDAGATDGATCTAREIACGDGDDNDCDGKEDCADTDCGGVTCSDGDPCTTGEVCSAGSCPRGSAVLCNSPTPCQAPNGTCEAGTGRCLYGALTDGTVCGAGAAARCCRGVCITTTTNIENCGGCGLACAAGHACQPIESGTCATTLPTNTSGRCTCSAGSPCPNGQICSSTSTCVPAALTQCAPMQRAIDGGACGAYCVY